MILQKKNLNKSKCFFLSICLLIKSSLFFTISAAPCHVFRVFSTENDTHVTVFLFSFHLTLFHFLTKLLYKYKSLPLNSMHQSNPKILNYLTMEKEGKVGTASSSRWNPTKEQITLLENLYKEGIRTPSADQIQQITSRLRVHGHIEGKNVFYWFQNHKARQRQKQKQERIAYFNRLLHKTSRFFRPPLCSNGT